MTESNSTSAFEVMNSALDDIYNIQALNDAINSMTIDAEEAQDQQRSRECAHNANRLSFMVKERLTALIKKLDEGSLRAA